MDRINPRLGSVRQNHLKWVGLLFGSEGPISSQIYKVVQKVVLRLGFTGIKPIFI
jgi:hypothetical protein